MQPQGVPRRPAQAVQQAFALSLAQCDDPTCRLAGLVRNLNHPGKEELHPSLPITVIAHRLQRSVVATAMHLEEVREIQDGLAEDALLAKHQDDKQATHAAVAVKERVDRLELRMGEAGTDARMRDGVASSARM